MTLRHCITKELHRKGSKVYICIGCREFGIDGLDETIPYSLPSWVLENPFRNRIRSGICPQCFEEYIGEKNETRK